jgi:hypothetical protein
MVQGSLADFSQVVDRSSPSGATVWEYEVGRLDYSLACWLETGLKFADYAFSPSYESVRRQGGVAILKVRPFVSLCYADGGVDQLGRELHVVQLLLAGGRWMVTGDWYTDEFVECYPRGTDFLSLKASLPAQMARFWERQEQLRRECDASVAGQDVGALTSYRAYDRTRAIQYASDHALSYNPLFKSYSADCQNFVSQCVWSGFGGQETSTAVQTHALPMIGYGYGGVVWWADLASSSYDSEFGWTWINVSSFCALIEENYDYNLIGVQGYAEPLSYVLRADYVIKSDMSHVLFVVGTTDSDGDGVTDYNEISVAAHTTDHWNVRLNTIYPNPSSVTFERIVRFRQS